MLSKTHRLTKAITTALGPLFHQEPDYSTILQAMGLVTARIAMATPDKNKESWQLEVIHEYSKQALSEFLRLEEEQAAKKTLVDKGIDSFTELFADKPELGVAALNGGMGSEARAAAEEAQAKQTARQEEAEQAQLDTYKED